MWGIEEAQSLLPKAEEAEGQEVVDVDKVLAAFAPARLCLSNLFKYETQGLFPLLDTKHGDIAKKAGLYDVAQIEKQTKQIEDYLKASHVDAGYVDKVREEFVQLVQLLRERLAVRDEVITPLVHDRQIRPGFNPDFDWQEMARLMHQVLQVDRQTWVDTQLAYVSRQLSEYGSFGQASVFARALQACSTEDEYMEYSAIIKKNIRPELVGALENLEASSLLANGKLKL